MSLTQAETFFNYLSLEGNFAEALEVYDHQIQSVSQAFGLGLGIFFQDHSMCFMLQYDLTRHFKRDTLTCLTATSGEDLAEQLVALSHEPGWEPLASHISSIISETQHVRQH